MTFIMIAACILMLIDAYQTVNILQLGENGEAEGNPIIRFIFKVYGLGGVIAFKVGISFIPFISPILAIIMLILYGYIVYHNFNCLKKHNESEIETENTKE